MVDCKLLSKYSEKLQLELFGKDVISEKELMLDGVLGKNPSFNIDKLNFINEHKNELK